ncbi:hypothetical protein HU200_007039 [Digitaria exilis]|uniref:aldehyde oxygenase (deformylating) n=1 Tax=Digitaria exilis TaxID=1010633 RepID=A0A835FR16_9POAL|nr:hypothetical protein HU200_007039 [Digitaria exilis]
MAAPESTLESAWQMLIANFTEFQLCHRRHLPAPRDRLLPFRPPLPTLRAIRPLRQVQDPVLFYFVLEDFIFYWGHRALHTKWLYKHVHSVHHELFGTDKDYRKAKAVDEKEGKCL